METIEKGKRVRLVYECRDLGCGQESGVEVGVFTDEDGGWGKKTFEPVGGPKLYLFEDEIQEIDEAPQTGCPECGSAELRYMEPVWCDRRLSSIAEDGTLNFHGEAEVNWEADDPGRAVVHCDSCDREWKPNEGSLDFV